MNELARAVRCPVEEAVSTSRPITARLGQGVFVLLAALLLICRPAVAGPYIRSLDTPLFFLAYLTLPAVFGLGLISTALARRWYRPKAESWGVWLYELLLSAGMTAGAFAIAWGAGAVLAFTLPRGIGWSRLYIICAVFYGAYIVVLRQWLGRRAQSALLARPVDEGDRERAAVVWWATWPVFGLVTVIFFLALLGTCSMLR